MAYSLLCHPPSYVCDSVCLGSEGVSACKCSSAQHLLCESGKPWTYFQELVK